VIKWSEVASPSLVPKRGASFGGEEKVHTVDLVFKVEVFNALQNTPLSKVKTTLQNATPN
jgi:hypothetical protein